MKSIRLFAALGVGSALVLVGLLIGVPTTHTAPAPVAVVHTTPAP